MRGGAQSHLMRCADGNFYVIKFQNNPQHRRVLANELLATRLAGEAGICVPETRVIEVTEWLIANSPEMTVDLGGRSEPCAPGLQSGARFAIDPFTGHIFDYLPAEKFADVENLAEFAGMLGLDKWTCNANGRQAVFLKPARRRKYRACFIDQGYCFNAGEWNFPDSPLRGVFARNEVYAGVTGWESFEPWLSRIERMAPETIAACADGIPPAWHGDADALDRLLEKLIARRARVRDLITEFRRSSREPFPRWREHVAVAH